MMRRYCGDVSLKDVGKKIKIFGWVRRVRDLGGVVFVNVRDITGEIQCVIEPEAEYYEAAKALGTQYVVEIEGVVRKRPESMINKDMKTGETEVVINRLKVLNTSPTPPFLPEDTVEVSEEVRLRYRFLDLRRPWLQSNIIKRSKLMKHVRDFLYSKGFHEIDTPYLTKSTPEGARDYVVPSRIHKGKFYALPQSPQLYKQVLMSSGFDKYFQIARCFRDEDLRADRQPEFTQIDLEMSFVDVEDVLNLTESLVEYVFDKLIGLKVKRPFLRLSYKDAIENYGSDKPDLRYRSKLIDFTPHLEKSGFRVAEGIINSGGKIIGVRTGKSLSRKEIEKIQDEIKKEGAAGLLWFKSDGEKLTGQLSKFIKGDFEPGTYLLVGEKTPKVYNLAGMLRDLVNKRFEEKEDELSILWVVDFPLFERNEETGQLEPAHHIFTMPREDTLKYLENQPDKVIGKQYDLVINGIELGSGSIRNHDKNMQIKLLKMIGFDDERIERNFGFLLEALEYGAPPHGGIALGFDRLLAVMLGLDSIRDVIPFPKTTSAQALYEGAPDYISEEQLKELHLKIRSDD